jgi:hypothetical protein
MKKLRQSRGESIAETLVALLIASLAIMLLTGAIVTSARINASLKSDDVAFRTERAGAASSGTAYIRYETQLPEEVPVAVHTTENGYIYYEKAD